MEAMNGTKMEEESIAKEDTGESTQCNEHLTRGNPNGICSFCLQEKLGKLVSSSSRLHVPAPSSSSASPSFRSDDVPATTSAAALRHSKAKVSDDTVFKRSKSVHCTPAKRNGGVSDGQGFWSFLHLSKSRTASVLSNEVKNGGGGAERRVRRSRSVGCGSRGFSGEFFEKISHGFGDCTNMEGKRRNAKETVSDGGIFGGSAVPSFNVVSWDDKGRKSTAQWLTRGRIKAWGWVKKITTKPKDSKTE